MNMEKDNAVIEINKLKQDLMNLNLQKYMGDSVNFSKFKTVKKQIARYKTHINNKNSIKLESANA